MNIKDIIKPALALIVVIATFSYFFLMLILGMTSDPQIIIAIVASQQIPLSYYFGASSGSTRKDEIIQDQIKDQK